MYRRDAMTGTLMPRVRFAKGEDDWTAAGLLLEEYLSWIAGEAGVNDVADVQPEVIQERNDLAGYYRRPDGALLIARQDEQPAGIAGLKRLAGGSVEFKRLYVAPRARGFNVGNMLLETGIAAVRAAGASRIVLETSPQLMPAAVHLYQRRGFQPTARHTDLTVADVESFELDLGRVPSGPGARSALGGRFGGRRTWGGLAL